MHGSNQRCAESAGRVGCCRRAKKTEERKNNKCIGKNNGSGLSCARAKDFARLRRVAGRRADAMQKACFPDPSWTE